MNIILASASPRRQEILSKMGIVFDVAVDNSPETDDPSMSPLQIAELNAIKKSENICLVSAPPSIIIGADTIVYLDGLVLGKPKDEADAAKMLKKLSNRTHYVYTSVCVHIKKTISVTSRICFTEKAAVSMRTITAAEINEYIETNEPMDKAGSYAAQGIGARFINEIDGDFYTVVGLPQQRLYDELTALGVKCRKL